MDNYALKWLLLLQAFILFQLYQRMAAVKHLGLNCNVAKTYKVASLGPENDPIQKMQQSSATIKYQK